MGIAPHAIGIAAVKIRVAVLLALLVVIPAALTTLHIILFVHPIIEPSERKLRADCPLKAGDAD